MEEEECEECEEGAPAWMATFSDLCSLLLTFFVLLLSFANMDKTEFREMLGSTREAFGVKVKQPGRFMGLTTTPIQFSDTESITWNPITARESQAIESMKDYVKKKGLSADVEVVTDDKYVTVRVKDRLAFSSASDELKEDVLPVLEKVLEMARAFPQSLKVSGHTDDRPMNSRKFPSNWELSGARASAALRYMEREKPLPVEELSIAGHADRVPLVPNTTPENRATNRRVEFVFRRDPRGKPKAAAKQGKTPASDGDGEDDE